MAGGLILLFVLSRKVLLNLLVFLVFMMMEGILLHRQMKRENRSAVTLMKGCLLYTSLTIDETEDDVMVTVNYLVAQGLMEIITENDEYFLTEIPSLIGSETASTRRSRKSRGQKVLQCNTDATPCNLLQQNCNVDIELEKEGEIEKISPNLYVCLLYTARCV